jgi:hypothetical protein
MKSLVCLSLSAAALAFAVNAHSQATLNAADGTLRIPSVTLGADVYTDVVLRLDPDMRFRLESAVPPGQGGASQTLQLTYAPQPISQYYYTAQGRQLATCSHLPTANITLKVPASATPARKAPLVISLSGWSPSGNPPAPVAIDESTMDHFRSLEMAAASFQYRGCDNWSSPLVARTNPDESFDIASSDFGLALAAIKAAVASRNLNVDTSKIVVVGTSFSSNLIYTVAVKHGLQGAIALAGGCDYNCNPTGTIYEQPDDFRVNGVPIRVAALSGGNDVLYPPLGLGQAGFGAHGARDRIMARIADPAKRPAAFYTYIAPHVGHEVEISMLAGAGTFAQCMTGVLPPENCEPSNR